MNLRHAAMTGITVSTIGATAIAAPFIAGWEGLRINAYYDPVGIETICYGHTRGVTINDTATALECRAQLNQELIGYLFAVDKYITVPMPDTRRAALTSFAYNVGIGNFKSSTLRKLMNQGRTIEACNELKRWVFAKGVKLRGLIRRREAERLLCLEGTTEQGQEI